MASKVALNLRRWRIACATHDVENPSHPPAYGIGISHFDMQRLDFEEGETLWPGVKIYVDGKTSGNFRVLCAAEEDHDKTAEAEAEVTVDAVGELVEV